jgi:hypothetical protein
MAIGEGLDLNWRRYFLALAATGIFTLVLDVLLNAVIFRGVFARSASFLLPAHELNARVPVGWAALLVIVAAFGFLLVRGGWLGLRRGFQFGTVLGVASVAGVAGITSVVAWPGELLLVVGVQQFLNGLLLGVVFGVVYRPASAR